MKKGCVVFSVFVFSVVVLTIFTVASGAVEVKDAGAGNAAAVEQNKPGPSAARIDQILSHLRKSDPNTASHLEKLRTENPDRFRVELREAMRAAYARDIIPARSQRGKNNLPPSIDKTIKLNAARSESVPIDKAYEQHLNWMKENYPKEAERLSSLKETDPNSYKEQLKISFNKYKNIARASRYDKPLADALKEELEVDEQIKKTVDGIKSAADTGQKQKLVEELKGLVGRKINIDVKKKQIEHQQMFKKLEKLQEQIKADESELKKQSSVDIRNSRIDAMMKNLIDTAENK